MTLMPDGRTERSVIDGELLANKEFRRLTHAYLARMRELYPQMSRPTKNRLTSTLQHLRDLAGPSGWQI
jgi:hypothetical protein